MACHQAFADLINSDRGDIGTLTRAQLRAAVDAIDDWLDTSLPVFNAAIPLPARSTLTPRQKVELLLIVTERRRRAS